MQENFGMFNFARFCMLGLKTYVVRIYCHQSCSTVRNNWLAELSDTLLNNNDFASVSETVYFIVNCKCLMQIVDL